MTSSGNDNQRPRTELPVSPYEFRRNRIYVYNGDKFFFRFSLHQRIQHIWLALSVLILILTGFPLKFPDSVFWQHVFALLGGIEMAPILHRIAGVALCTLFVYHMIYFIAVFYREDIKPMRQRGEFTFWNALVAFYNVPMIPHVKDGTDLVDYIKYHLFISDKKPRYDKFMWKEKFDYFAVYWGTPLLGLTGIFMWNLEFFSHYLPGIVFNISYIAHTDEALLAASFLLVWHIYNTHLHRHKFPMGRVFITGYLSEHDMIEEHYDEYVTMMKAEGLEHEIKGQYEPGEHEHHWQERKSTKLIFGGVISAVAVVLIWMILDLSIYSSHGFFPRERPKKIEPPPQTVLKEVRLEGISALEGFNNKEEYRGYRLDSIEDLSGHFHNVGIDIASDQHSSCVACHGDLVHEDIDIKRSYINMHTFYFSCEVCHVPRQQNGEELFANFYWFSKDGGEVQDEALGCDTRVEERVDCRIAPFVRRNGRLERFDGPDRAILSSEYQDLQATLSRGQRVDYLRRLHDGLTPEPVSCRDCHDPEIQYLPFRELGYSEQRIRELTGSAILGLIEKYDQDERFHLPQLFSPRREGR
ncbi:formate dehydrogenase subunit gamma [Desulfurivibrio dismutans]|uniref:formate dehydrogenase subunit gamma n=1 Tax=Desulfurivibrio dismutans TaxID=1398908 RepID=UPI0023D9FA1B|nr:cytochrome b/b6 domain-containing protein [Desulfurivibrio alkaliphilus]MDF1613886.1 cytochrome b/b6 domain-containing protein [Desulfurivibrio alkaliphilus]